MRSSSLFIDFSSAEYSCTYQLEAGTAKNFVQTSANEVDIAPVHKRQYDVTTPATVAQ